MKGSFALVAALVATFTLANIEKVQANDNRSFRIVVPVGGRAIVSCPVEVIVNSHSARNAEDVLFVAGMAHSGSAFRPLAEALIADPQVGKKVKRAVLLNFPGRDDCAFPESWPRDSVKFGDLGLDDYANVLVGALLELRLVGISVDRIVAHSMGGLVVQIAQDRLLDRSTSLRALGVKNITVIGSAAPKEVPNAFLDSGMAVAILNQFVVTSPELGQYVSVPLPNFLGLFFTDYTQQLVPNAPSPETIIAEGYQAIESYAAAFETVGTSTDRPSVAADVFAPQKGTSLRVVVGAQDVFNNVPQQQLLYQHLTGDISNAGVSIINSADAVHDVIISNPAEVVPFLGL